jgi:hypothetical protein
MAAALAPAKSSKIWREWLNVESRATESGVGSYTGGGGVSEDQILAMGQRSQARLTAKGKTVTVKKRVTFSRGRCVSSGPLTRWRRASPTYRQRRKPTACRSGDGKTHGGQLDSRAAD